MLQELLTLNLWAFFMIFARVGAALSVMPGFSAGHVNIRARLALALLISLVVTPILAANLPVMPNSAAAFSLMLASESLVGFFIGAIGQVVVGALQAAGSFIALFSSLSNALIQDPIAEQQSSIVAGFLTATGVMLIFVTDTHHLIVKTIVASYGAFEPGQPLELGDMADFLAHRVSAAFELGLRMAAPLGLTGLTYYIGLGILGRLMPALPVFFFGLPVQIAMQLIVLALTLSATMMLFIDYFHSSMTAILGS